MQENSRGSNGSFATHTVLANAPASIHPSINQGRSPRATPLASGDAMGATSVELMEDAGVDRYVSRGVELAMQVAQLPAIPTAFWCRDAATTLAPIGDFQRAAVGIARMSPDGTIIEEVISVGVHVPGGHVEHMEDMISRIRNMAWLPPTAKPSMDRAWAIAVDADAMRRSQTSTQGTPWHLTISPRIMIGGAPFGDACERYMLITAVGANDQHIETSALLPALRALTSLLAKRARVALGCPDKPIRWISPREQQVLELLIEGMSVKEIGEALGRSPHTITDHLKSLHRKLEATSRGELVAKALGRHSMRGGTKLASNLLPENTPKWG